MEMHRLLDPSILPFVVGALAIIVWGITRIMNSWIRHRERLAMIERGLHPDYPPGGDDPKGQP